MKHTLRITSLFTLFSSMLLMHGQPVIEWQRCIGGSNSEYGHSIQQTADGGYVVAGYTESNSDDVSGNQGGSDFWVVKLEGDGSIQWQKCLGGSGGDEAYTIQQTSDGGYIVAGATYSIGGDVSGNHGGGDVWVVKLDISGTIQWQKCLGGSSGDQANDIWQTSDLGYVMAGHTSSNNGDVSGNHGGQDAWIVKLDISGNIQWQKCLGGSSEDQANSIRQTIDGGFVMAGHTRSNNGDVSGNHGFNDAWVVKMDNSGIVQWQKCMGGSGWEEANSIELAADGGYVIAGRAGSNNNGDVVGNHGLDDVWIVKLNETGSIQWQKCIGGSGHERAHFIRSTNDNGYIVAGYTSSNNGDVSGYHDVGVPGGRDAWVVRIDGVGTIQWQKCLGGGGWQEAFSVRQVDNGEYVAVGYTYSFDEGDVYGSHGLYDVWVVKLSGGTGTNIGEANQARFSIAPNPATVLVAVTFVQQAKPRKFTLLDATGRTVLEQPVANTTSPITLDLSGHENGLYLVQVLFADGTRAVERVVKE